MPAYEYDCAQCGSFTVMRPMRARNDPQLCPGCGTPAMRLILTAPALAAVSAVSLAAHATNERAAHEPKLSSKHGANCTCCNGGRESDAASSAGGGVKSFSEKRPWMISH